MSARTVTLVTVLAIAPAVGQAPAPYVPGAVAPPGPPARSVVFDQKRARELAPLFVERIDVEGDDPDARRPRPKTVEQRFAEALAAPRRAGAIGTYPDGLDTRPCLSLPSTFTNIGTAFNPAGFCP